MQNSGLLFTSCSQNRSTDQPSLLSFLETALSLLILFSILSFQNFFAGFFFSKCQKSPSQKIAIFFLFKIKSGFPCIFGYISNLQFISESSFFILRSIFVFLLLILDITQDLFSLEKISVNDLLLTST